MGRYVMFHDIYKGKNVVVTGHTGFKGAWLTAWLLKLGARVIGISLDIPTQPSMFDVLGLREKIDHHVMDIRDMGGLQKVISDAKPDFIFHLAAQAIVSRSYDDPIDTISTNVLGTSHLLQSMRSLDNACVGIIITSDKAYENVEWPWGYRETDRLGGKDVYSASKGAAEIIIHAFDQSFFSEPGGKVRIASARAGNVIGGGDWAKDRIVVDCVRSWSEGNPVKIRSPKATRPWQHVLEPLSGYLLLGESLSSDINLRGTSFNFGPASDQSRSVEELLTSLGDKWNATRLDEYYRIVDEVPFHEAGLLKLNCDKAALMLDWLPTLQYEETTRLVSDWYNDFYNKNSDMYELTMGQLSFYENQAVGKLRVWTH